MIRVNFYKNNTIPDNQLRFVVIMAQYESKWVLVRHRDRTTWEIPGGHIESQESVKEAAKRELYEETGATRFDIQPISIYSVSRDDGEESFGQLYYGIIAELGDLPDSEIVEVKLVERIEEELTYPEIQPFLAERVLSSLINVMK